MLKPGSSKVCSCEKGITDAIFQIEFCSSPRQSNYCVFYYTVSSVLVGRLNCLPSQQRLPPNYLCAAVKPRPGSFSPKTTSLIMKQVKKYSNNRMFLNAHHQSHLFSQGIISMSRSSQNFSLFFSIPWPCEKDSQHNPRQLCIKCVSVCMCVYI